MLAKRIIPCLDVDHSRVKKGVNFVNLQDVGDPTEIAAAYQKQGADELVFLDITATNEKRKAIVETIEQVASQVFMPLTVGGGIHDVSDMMNLLRAGADKTAVNSAAVRHPELITQGAEKFGSQCVVLAIDAKFNPQTQTYQVYVNGGRKATNLDAVQWAKEGVKRGAGELLVTSMDKDGTKSGYDIDLYRQLTKSVSVPVIASGGCGKLTDFSDVFQESDVDGALAASVFHFGELTISDVKQQLKTDGVIVR
ncbi:imidazole glycerol phosphate synthase subunit HisF [Lentilactobacillus hilgardii]|uniref:imidazole glycerol phosphate synthase subunit HisF n=1 Tax=Lentilactobacillus hilgardii TaxID=1588 RepID=UPI0021A817B2|nr:imidazole glycerol phosphate synthase subunit HisF [Lentilactobacillus hilgardii]MCT3399317.1 imidazole glycerol phosphate synthase subunit HisF [Lentilactobacillus hilgardii]